MAFYGFCKAHFYFGCMDKEAIYRFFVFLRRWCPACVAASGFWGGRPRSPPPGWSCRPHPRPLSGAWPWGRPPAPGTDCAPAGGWWGSNWVSKLAWYTTRTSGFCATPVFTFPSSSTSKRWPDGVTLSRAPMATSALVSTQTHSPWDSPATNTLSGNTLRNNRGWVYQSRPDRTYLFQHLYSLKKELKVIPGEICMNSFPSLIRTPLVCVSPRRKEPLSGRLYGTLTLNQQWLQGKAGRGRLTADGWWENSSGQPHVKNTALIPGEIQIICI